MKKLQNLAGDAIFTGLRMGSGILLSLMLNACSWWSIQPEDSPDGDAKETIAVVKAESDVPEASQPVLPKTMPTEKQDIEVVKSPVTDQLQMDKSHAVPSSPPKMVEKKSIPIAAPTKKILKKNPNHFVITVNEKNQSHPFYQKGHHLGFLIDNVQGGAIVVKRGQAYEFTINTDVKHDVYLSTSHLGWGGGVLTNGVVGNFTYDGTINLKVDDNTPEVLYYQCRNHNSMGGKILVMNADASQQEINAILQSSKIKNTKDFSSPKLKFTGITKDKVQQKIAFADMMLKAKAAKRISASNNQEAKNIFAKAKSDLILARQELKNNNQQKALTLANAVVRSVGVASRLVPSEEVLERQKNRYQELLDALNTFKKSHAATSKITLKKRGKDAVVDFDLERVSLLEKEAKDYASQGQYVIAGQYLENAERMVTVAINEMMDSQTVVYDLNFETAEEEYKYELSRFKSYEELVPIAIEQKKPSKGAIGLMNNFLKKGREQKDIAVKTANSGDFPRAIAMLLSATDQVRRALRIAGISQ